MNGRIPLAQPLTLDFNLVAVRNAARGLQLLGAASVADLVAAQAAVGSGSAQSAALAALNARLSALESSVLLAALTARVAVLESALAGLAAQVAELRAYVFPETPVYLLDENGNTILDENGNPILAG